MFNQHYKLLLHNIFNAFADKFAENSSNDYHIQKPITFQGICLFILKNAGWKRSLAIGYCLNTTISVFTHTQIIPIKEYAKQI